jgi:uncharacterized protein (TIGR02118 family)
MTAKLIAIYRKPEDENAFWDHYKNIHTPLVEKVPGLTKVNVNRVFGSPMGETDIFMIAELHFADKAALDLGMRSEENRAAGKDLMGFARGLVTIVLAEEL